METLLISELAKLAGVKPQTIRYYEQIGVLTPALRSPTGYRRFGHRAIEELTFIKRAQALGFSLEEITEILDLGRSGTAPCSRVLVLARAHVAELEARIDGLRRLKAQIVAAIERWEDGGVPADCVSTFCGLITGAGIDEPKNPRLARARGPLDRFRSNHSGVDRRREANRADRGVERA
jgi:MerR family transcriptional regulator, copper efflux regulator